MATKQIAAELGIPRNKNIQMNEGVCENDDQDPTPPHSHISQVSDSQLSQSKWGICSVCYRKSRLLSDGITVYRHGHGGKCLGSGKPCTTSIGQHSHQIAIQPSQSIQANDGVTSFEPVQESFRLSHPFLPGPTLKHIPKGARQTCANRLIVLIRNVIENPEEEDAWMTLLQFGPDVLLKPARGGKRHNLTNTIKSRCADNKTGHVMSNIETTSRRNRNPEATLAAAVSSKIEDGNLKAAIRLLCSEETVAPFDSDTHAQLRLNIPHHLCIHHKLSHRMVSQV